MKQLRLFALLLILPVLFIYTGCSEDNTTQPTTEQQSESEILIKYLETNDDYVNTAAPAIIPATDVYTGLQTNANFYIIDIRSATDYAAGHIQGAVNVALGDAVNHVKGLAKANAYDKIIVACYSGQSAGYVVSMLRLLGYDNVYSLKWGMSSWNPACDGWTAKISNEFSTQLETAANPKNSAGKYPTLNTGKTDGKSILESRILTLLTDGFGAATVSAGTVFGNPDNYYIINYWNADHYNWGHIPGAIQYTPRGSGTVSDFHTTKYLNTLPTDKTIVVYCYSGQTSAQIAAFLKALGYDAKTLTYGMNSISHDNMPAGKFVTAAEVKDYPLE